MIPLTEQDSQAFRAIVDFAHDGQLGATQDGGITVKENEGSNPSVVQAPLATESGHWYDTNGKPRYTITGANGKERPTTLRDARKLGLVPSSTTILKVPAAPALDNYKANEILKAAWSRRWTQLQESDFERFCQDVKAQAREHAKQAADKGTGFHAEIERFLRGELVQDKAWLPHIANVVRTTVQYGLNVREGEAEKSFAHQLGFGGKVDWHQRDEPLLIDFKTKPTIEPGKRYAYGNHAMQLASYRVGLGIPNARCINLFVGIEDRKLLIHEWPQDDLRTAWRKFKLILRYWQLENNYTPKIRK